MVKRMTEGLQSSTKDFSHIIIESYPPISRDMEREPGEKIKNIMKCHSLFFTKHNQLKGLALSCMTCTVGNRCSSCKE